MPLEEFRGWGGGMVKVKTFAMARGVMVLAESDGW